MNKLLMAATTAVLTSCAAMPVMALEGPDSTSGASCAPREFVVQEFTEEWGEVVHAMGVASEGFVVEMWGNEESGSFTVTITDLVGWTCVIFWGEQFARNPLPNA